jgi:hypothetical protein
MLGTAHDPPSRWRQPSSLLHLPRQTRRLRSPSSQRRTPAMTGSTPPVAILSCGSTPRPDRHGGVVWCAAAGPWVRPPAGSSINRRWLGGCRPFGACLSVRTDCLDDIIEPELVVPFRLLPERRKPGLRRPRPCPNWALMFHVEHARGSSVVRDSSVPRGTSSRCHTRQSGGATCRGAPSSARSRPWQSTLAASTLASGHLATRASGDAGHQNVGAAPLLPHLSINSVQGSEPDLDDERPGVHIAPARTQHPSTKGRR